MKKEREKVTDERLQNAGLMALRVMVIFPFLFWVLGINHWLIASALAAFVGPLIRDP